METKINLKKILIDLYNKENEDNPNKIDLTKPARSHEDPFFKDFKKEINKALNKDNEDLIKNDSNTINAKTEKKEEEINDQTINDPDILKKLSQIEKNVSDLLNVLNMSLYRYKKEDLKNLIINDMLIKYFKSKINDSDKEKIIDAIIRLADNQFKQYESKKEQKRQDTLNYILSLIMPEINNFVEKHSKHGLETLTIVQKENIIKYFIISIENKYLKAEKTIKNINEADYDFIKKRIGTYIINRLKQQDEIIKESME